MPDANERARRWRAKYDTDRVKQSLDVQRDTMAARYEAAMVDVVAMEDQVRQVLNGAGVPTAAFVNYLNFGRQLYKLSRARGISGESLALEARVLLVKWRDRGCREEVLARIRTEVFNVGEAG
jgi:hypothetical protein